MKKLVSLYAKMAALTAPECQSTCKNPFSCCDQAYCEAAIQYAKDNWGVILTPVNGKDARGQPLPLMGDNGCIAPPHLRPLCTLHTCEINSLGCKKGDPNWTRKYFTLRSKIEAAESL